LIRDYIVTNASVHASVPFLALVPGEPSLESQPIDGDSAYVGKAMAEELRRRGYAPQICEKGYRCFFSFRKSSLLVIIEYRLRSRCFFILGS
jgi:hypothetical protein